MGSDEAKLAPQRGGASRQPAQLAGQRDLLIYLWANRQVAMTAADLAWQVKHVEGEVASALENLERLALVHHQCMCDMTFHRLTGDKMFLVRLDRFINWCGGWLARAHRVERLVGPVKLAINVVEEMASR